MTNPFYVASGTPATSSFGASQPMRSEFQAIQGGFEKFPDFTGSAPGTFLINNFTATGITTAPTMLIDASGNIGIGTPPNPTTYLIDIRRDRASGSNLRLMNASLDPASGVGITLNNGSLRNFHINYLSQFAVNSGINRLDGAILIATGDGGLTLATGVGTPAAGLYFATNSIERARFDNNGVFTVHTITQFDTNVSVTGSLSSNGPLTVGAVGMPGSIFFKRDSDGAIQTRISENSGNNGLYFETTSGGWFSFFTSGAGFGSNVERMRIDSSGNVSIGQPGSIPLSITRNQDAETMAQVTNTGGGANSVASVRVNGGGSGYGSLAYFGTGSTPSSVQLPDGVMLASTGTGGLTLSAFYVANMRFCTNFVERMRIDSAGNVGIGVAPGVLLDAFRSVDGSTVVKVNNTNAGGNAYATFAATNGIRTMFLGMYGTGSTATGIGGANKAFIQADTELAIWVRPASPLTVSTNDVERMRIDAAGNVGIGTASPGSFFNDQSLVIAGGTNAVAVLAAADAGTSLLTFERKSDPGNHWGYIQYVHPSNYMLFATNGAERMRITATGFLKASSSGTYFNVDGAYHELKSNGATAIAICTNTNAVSPAGLSVFFSGASPNDTSTYFLINQDSVGLRSELYSNGGLGNYSANNVNLSDANVKDQITPYSKAELAALEQSFTNVIWGKFKYRDQTHDDWNHGPTAQGVERAFENSAPELVDESELGAKPESGVKHKVIYETDLVHIAHALLAKVMKDVAMLKTYLPRA